jgi:hypothetical protein
VILHDDGAPRLVDFGLAAPLGSGCLRELCGTPGFMAPEQTRGEGERIDFRTDIFGLGGVLYALLTGQAPHPGSTWNEVLERAKKAEITPPRQLEPTIPTPVEAVCLKALAAAPENRYTTALEFAAALRQAIEPPPVAPPTPAGIPAWVRWGLPAAVVACGLLAIAIGRWTRGPEIATPAAPDRTSGPAAVPLQAEIAVKLFKELGDGRTVVLRGTISETSLASDPPQLKDMFGSRSRSRARHIAPSSRWTPTARWSSAVRPVRPAPVHRAASGSSPRTRRTTSA